MAMMKSLNREDLLRRPRTYDFGKPVRQGIRPYAVPREYITGVVTNVFWPPSRWQIVRPEE